MPSLVYDCYGKINLYLDVLQRRRDGFHNIETIFQTVSLADRLTIEPEDALSLTCSRDDLDCGEDNLVMRAARALQEETGSTQGARIHLDKNIPMAGGMAGGSVDAAGALLGLNELWGVHVSKACLQRIALRLGSDVPYCLFGGTMGATRRGEELFTLPPAPEAAYVLVHPGLAVSAASVYGSPNLLRNPAPVFAGRTAHLRAAIRSCAAADWSSLVANSMESAVFEQHLELAMYKKQLLEAGCVAAAMSGSGSTLLGVCSDEAQATRVASSLDVETTVVHAVSEAVVRVK
jgi:4-diphosphocytidyl-2-C-methyl-D-erythritol kinase